MNLEQANHNLDTMKKGDFIIPEQYKIVLVSFNYNKFIDVAKKGIKARDISDYYNRNKQTFTKPQRYKSFASVKKEIRAKLTKMNKVSKKKVTAADVEKYYNDNKYSYQLPREYQTLKEATKVITKLLVKIRSKQLATRAAGKFTRDNYRQLAVATGDKKTLFIANANKVKEATLLDKLGWFGKNTPIIKGVGKEPELIKSIAAIDPKTTSVSNAVAGSTSAYVALLIDKKPLRLATLKEVKKEVIAHYKKEKALQLAQEEGRNTLAKLLKSKDIKKSLLALEKSKKIKFNKLNTFPAKYAEYFNIPSSPFKVAVATKEGQLSPFITTKSGGFFLIVDKRIVPTDKELEASAKTFRDNYDAQKSNAILSNFMSWVIIKNSKSQFLPKK
jgi:hypothetical protein